MNQWVLLVSLLNANTWHTADTKPWYFSTRVECEAIGKTLQPYFEYRCRYFFVNDDGKGNVTMDTAR